jgi:hypothetical protein
MLEDEAAPHLPHLQQVQQPLLLQLVGLVGLVPLTQAVILLRKKSSVADPDPGSGAFLTPEPGSGIGFSGSRNSDPGYQAHIFESLVTNFLVKSSIIL